MSELPKVGQKYQDSCGWEVVVTEVVKRGRGYQVWSASVHGDPMNGPNCDRLKEFTKVYSPCKP